MKTFAYEQLARIGKAMSSPARLEMLDLLRNGARTVECLAKAADLGVAIVSRHLQVLRGTGLVKSEKHGLYVTYHIADPSVWRLQPLSLSAGFSAVGYVRMARGWITL